MLFPSSFFFFLFKKKVEFSAVGTFGIGAPLQTRAALLQEGFPGCDNCVSLIPTVMLAGQTGSAIRGASSSSSPLLPPHSLPLNGAG